MSALKGDAAGRQQPPEVHVVWVEAPDDAIHLVDGIFAATDGLVNVRREYVAEDGRKFFKVYVAPGALDEVCALLRAMRACVQVGELRVDP